MGVRILPDRDMSQLSAGAKASGKRRFVYTGTGRAMYVAADASAASMGRVKSAAALLCSVDGGVTGDGAGRLRECAGIEFQPNRAGCCRERGVATA